MENLADMTPITAAIAGLGLSAAAGFRVFVPLLVLGIAGRMEILPVSEEFSWAVSLPAIIVFGTATVAEVASYYIPWVDNLLDSIATPAAAISGTVISAAVLPEMNDILQWGIATVLGGGSAGLVQTGTVLTRGASTATSGGLANPVVSTAELGGAVATSILALIIPLLIGLLVILLMLYILIKIVKRTRTKPTPEPSR